MIVFIIGTKAELIKCMPVMLELNRRKKEYFFIHTGQHALGEACKEFGLKRPDIVLSKEPLKSTKFYSRIKLSTFLWCIKTLFSIRKIIRKIKPKYVIYHGDTMNTAIASIASSKLLNPLKKWKSVHLEAGLESGSLKEPFPEEISRQIVGRFTDILLAVSDRATENLKKRKIKFAEGEIIQVGNTIMDSAFVTYQKAKKRGYKKPRGEYALINIHRYENLRSKKRMSQIIEIIQNVSINIIWPMHDNTQKYLEEYHLMKKLQSIKNLKITHLESYDNFLFLISNCKYLITDGGSIQEESLIFKKPCLLMRKRTERPEGLATGLNFLTKLDLEYSKRMIKDIENGHIKVKAFKNPYGKKGVSKKIVDLLK